jgi:hypothetical protein
VISRDNVKVVGRAIVLVVLGTSYEFLVVHDPEICSLDRVVSVESVRDSMLTVVVCPPSYFNFISYAVTLTSLCTIGLDRRRLSPCITSWIWDRVPWMLAALAALLAA